ncbi:MAG: SirB2 family protein [Thiobacillaceae bacterium]|nr:SirB2 family protein [Thiobacillaceae bacterium]MDW8324001.1 SirB2 family protein [Burkholderiales bacterium]
MEYTLLRLIHVGTVYVTFVLFVLRGVWMMLDSPRLSARWVRILPHVNDTVLLVAAIGMLVVASINPLEQPWLLAKIAGLIAYVVLGSLALRRGRSKSRRVAAFFAALLVFAYILAVGVTKQVLPGIV